MKYLLLTIYILCTPLWGKDCSYRNLTGTSKTVAGDRTEIFENPNDPGIRLSWVGMKAVNKEGIGKINKVIDGFESKLCDQFSSPEFKSKNPGVEVKVNKMDFKGYYITCTPSPACLSTVTELTAKIPAQDVPNAANPKNAKFELTSARAVNYQEGYIKSKVQVSYPDYKVNQSLSEFIDKKLSAAVKEATGSDISKIDLGDETFKIKLRESIAAIRAGKGDSVDPKMKPLVQALDDLLETPFVGTNNLEKEMKAALETAEGATVKGKYVVSTAISGDDLFVIVKDKSGKVLKIVGADARGLGVTNMETRYNQVAELYKGKGIQSTQDILDLSSRAITDADLKMDGSIERYKKAILERLESAGPGGLDDALKAAHLDYHQLSTTDSKFMQMRTAMIPNCVPKNACILDSITATHNLLKEMEVRGIDGHFGDSCLGGAYWMRKLKIPFPSAK
ncbi:MAG: hypothetical protein HN509_01895 [Halobacteriovoraceae bacterium]|nr:hypothetical protein [Halobacteriovoraceae bacterium]